MRRPAVGEVVFVDYPGVSCSSGSVRIADTPSLTIAFLTGLDPSAIDLLASRIGGLSLRKSRRSVPPSCVASAAPRAVSPPTLRARREDRDPPSSLREGYQ